MVLRGRSVSKWCVLAVALMVAWTSLDAQPVAGPDGVLVPRHLALTNTHVINIRNGEVLRDAVVVVQGGKIVSVGTGAPPAGLEVVNLEGRYLMPGLMDGHWHGSSFDNLLRALESGVTTVKSAGSPNDIQMKAAINAGYLAGPEILAAGVYVNWTPGTSALVHPQLFKYLNREIRGVDAVREVVRINAEMGADWIKTRTGGAASSPIPSWDPKTEVYNLEEMTALSEEAAKHGMPVSCHAHGEHTILVAIRGGCRTIEHGFYMTERALKEMKEKGTIWNPTYYSTEGYLLPHDDYDSSASRLRAPYVIHNMRKTMRIAHTLGVPMITSTDTAYGRYTVTRVAGEIVAFVEHAGMTPLEALQSATTVSAEVYGLADRTGAIEAGLEADLVAFDENPLEDIWAVWDPMFVMSNGHLIYHRTSTAEGHIPPTSPGYGSGGPRPDPPPQ